MKIPKTLKIAGRNIKVIIDGKTAKKDWVNGKCYADRDEILLDDYKTEGISKGCMEQTFIHEVLHKCNNLLSKDNSEVNTEEYVNPLAELLYQVFQQIENGNR